MEQDESGFLAPLQSNQIPESGLELEGMVRALGDKFLSHPGFAWKDTGFEVLHADWPAYPVAHGLWPALQTFAEFPLGTRFWNLDQIDQSTLFFVGDKRPTDAFAPHFLHVAVWDDDLRVCNRRGYVAGIQDNEGTDLYFPDGPMTLTEEGAHASLIRELTQDVDATLLSKVEDHLYSKQYGTAVREAAICVEMKMRQAVNSPLYGMQLVDHCFKDGGMLVPWNLVNFHRLGLRTVFQAYFKYTRNEYAHDFPQPDVVTGCRLVRRSGDLMRVLKILTAMLNLPHKK